MGNCLSGHDPWSGFKHNHLALGKVGKVIVQSSKKKKPAHNNGNGQNVPVSTDIGSVPASSNIVSVPLTSAIGSVPVTGNYVTAVEAPKDIGDLQQLTSLRDLTIFTYKELTMATDYFRPDLILGEGGFGLVYKGVIDEKVRRGFKSTKVAVKERNPDGHQGDREWLAEVNYLGQFSHPNLVRLVGYCYEDKHRLLVYEYMAHGSLETHLFRRHNTLTWPIRMKIALDAAKGLAFLHGAERPIIFRDFKTSNILLDAEFNAKLSDFGLAKEGPMGDQTHVSTRVMGTYGYAAPEYIMTGHLTTKSDVYGFGVVLLEIILGKRALDKRRPKHEQNLVDWARPLLIRTTKLLRVIDPKMQGQYTSKTASKVGNLAHRCLSENPKIRPTMKEVVETLETYNQEEMMYQSDRAAGNIQGGSEETFDRPDGQQTVPRAGSGGTESVVHGRREIKQGNERSNGDSPPPEESDHHKHSPPLESIGVNINNTHARPPPERNNYER